jgi:hypothetical protein
MRDRSPFCPYEISVNGRLCYCSGKANEKLRESGSVDSEEIEKGAIIGYFIYLIGS